MGLFKASLALLCFLGLALAHLSHAQNTPQDYLALHNAARAEVGVQPMTWDKKLANYASQYVREKLIGDCNLDHSEGPYGENLAAGGAAAFNGADAVKMWVSEKPYYNYNTNSCVGGECGHYTQVVWNTSMNVGCARMGNGRLLAVTITHQATILENVLILRKFLDELWLKNDVVSIPQ